MKGHTAGPMLELALDLRLPLAALTEKLAILAQSGAGKTYAGMKIAEEMLGASAQVICIDPVGVWWGLRSSADGHKAGLPILVFGGDHHDIPLSPRSGALVARLLAEKGLPAVLDISEFTDDEQALFVADFAEHFLRAKKKHRSPVHIFWEEAQVIIPEVPESKGAVRMRAQVIRLMRIGRNMGIGWTAITQQPQDTSKRGLNQAGTLLVMRMVGSHEKAAVSKQVSSKLDRKAMLELLDLLPSLETGQAYVWSPSFLGLVRTVKIARRWTFDSSKTPEVGERLPTAKVLAKVDIEHLRAELETVQQEASGEDPEILQRQITQLRQQLARQRPPEAVKVPVLEPGEISRIADLVAQARQSMEALAVPMKALTDRLAVSGPARSPPPHPGTVAARPAPRVRATPSAQVHLGAGHRKMLVALARVHPRSISKVQLGLLSGFSPGGGTFRTYLPQLQRGGFVDVAGDHVSITQAGLGEAGGVPVDAPGTLEAARAMWLSALESGPRKMLEELIAVYPEALTPEELGRRSGYAHTGGTFRTYLPKLIRLVLAQRTREGNIHASTYLFEQ